MIIVTETENSGINIVGKLIEQVQFSYLGLIITVIIKYELLIRSRIALAGEEKKSISRDTKHFYH